MMERLGRNLGRYHGETIEIETVQAETHQRALAAGWVAETFSSDRGWSLHAYHRLSPGASTHLYLSTGIHGDEPSGPLALLELLRENRWPRANLWLVPCLNPEGFRLNRRENAQGIDLNRDYRDSRTAEIAGHTAWLARQPRFDLSLLLHEDWEANGFYLYELDREGWPGFAERIVESVRPVCPIETAPVVDDFPCANGVIRPAVQPEERPQWAEAIYLSEKKSRRIYNFETPSDYPLPVRVRAHVAALRRAFASIEQGFPVAGPAQQPAGVDPGA